MDSIIGAGGILYFLTLDPFGYFFKMEKQYHILVSGSVQGVGFRFTARALAARYKVKGWVRNTYSGEVELEVAGSAPDVDGFLRSLQEEFKHNITAFKVDELSLAAEFRGFQIRF